MAYSVLAQPTGELADRLQGIISRTARENGTHSFVPHVTVAGPIQNRTGEEVLRTLQEVAATLPAYTLRLDHVSQSTSMFQCVFVLVHKDEEVLRAAAAAQRAFGQGDGTGYMPHLSLIYADISQEERTKLVDKFQAELSQPSEGGGPPLLSASFTCEALSLWLTPLDGPTEDWTHIAEVPLLGGCAPRAASCKQ